MSEAAVAAAKVLAMRCDGLREPSVQTPADDGFVDVRAPHSDKLLFRYDPARRLVEIVQRGVTVLVDLTMYEG